MQLIFGDLRYLDKFQTCAKGNPFWNSVPCQRASEKCKKIKTDQKRTQKKNGLTVPPFREFLMPFDTERNYKMDSQFGTNLKLVEILNVTKDQLHKLVMTLFRKFVFCATDVYLANGIRYWIFLLHGCWTIQINIYSPKGSSVKPFLSTFFVTECEENDNILCMPMRVIIMQHLHA